MSGRVTVENVRVLKGVLAGVSRCKIPFVNIRRLKFTKVNRKPIRKSDRRNEIDSSEDLKYDYQQRNNASNYYVEIRMAIFYSFQKLTDFHL